MGVIGRLRCGSGVYSSGKSVRTASRRPKSSARRFSAWPPLFQRLQGNAKKREGKVRRKAVTRVFHMVYSRTAVGHPMILISQTTKEMAPYAHLMQSDDRGSGGSFLLCRVVVSSRCYLTRARSNLGHGKKESGRNGCQWVSEAVIV